MLHGQTELHARNGEPLQAVRRRVAVRLLDSAAPPIRSSKEVYLAIGDVAVQVVNDGRHRNRWIVSVEIVDVDAVGLEPGQRIVQVRRELIGRTKALSVGSLVPKKSFAAMVKGFRYVLSCFQVLSLFVFTPDGQGVDGSCLAPDYSI